MPQVKCTVSNCYFWKNDFCNASEIEVAVNARAKTSAATTATAATQDGAARRADLEIGQVGAVATPQAHRVASNTDETCCVTFRPKDKAGLDPATQATQDGRPQTRKG